MYIEAVPNRNSPPAVLLRESYREGAKVRKRTLANLSDLSAAQIEAIRAALRGEALQPVTQSLEITASRPHGHVQAVALAMQRLGLASLLAAKPCRERGLVLAMIAARIVAPHTKLATTRWWHTTTLASDFGVADANEDDLYAAMDWLLARQDALQNKLSRRHLSEGGLVLYDLSSSYFEGSTCCAGQAGAQPRWQEGAAAGQLRLAHRCARLPGGGVGARGQRGRQRHLPARGAAAARALWHRATGDRR